MNCFRCGTLQAGSFCTNCGAKLRPEKQTAEKSRKPLALIIAVTLLLGLVAVGWNVASQQSVARFGQLEVQMETLQTSNRFEHQLYTFYVNEQSISLAPRSENFLTRSEWLVGEAVSARLESRFVEEGGSLVTASPTKPDPFTLGSVPAVRVKLVITDTAIDTEIWVNPNENSSSFQLLAKTTMARADFSASMSRCKTELNAPLVSPIEYAKGLERTYREAVEDSRLFNVTEGLTYSEWARRARSLQISLQSINQELKSKAPSAAPQEWLNLESVFQEVMSAWSDFEDAARSQSESRWEPAYVRIFEAEDAIAPAVSQVLRLLSAAEDTCASRLTKD